MTPLHTLEVGFSDGQPIHHALELVSIVRGYG
jgi:hypothetical protein